MGIRETPFHIHRRALSRSCAFFRLALEGNARDGEDRSIKLPEVPPKAFDLFANWLYEGSIKSDDQDLSSGMRWHYLAVYSLAHKLEITPLKNSAMNILRVDLTDDVTDGQLRQMFKDAPAGSRYRDFVVAFTAFWLTTPVQPLNDLEIDLLVDLSPVIAKAVFRYLRDSPIMPLDPRTLTAEDACARFHDHPDGVICRQPTADAPDV